MTLHDIESALPTIIEFDYFDYYSAKEVEVNIYGEYMGKLYDTVDGLYYKSQCYHNNIHEYLRRDTFLSYFNYVLLLNMRYGSSNDLQIYKLEPKFRIVYK